MTCDKGYIKLPDGACLRIFDPKMDPHGFEPDFYLPEYGIKISVKISWNLTAKTLNIDNITVKKYIPKTSKEPK